jgi:hypothetical protein
MPLLVVHAIFVCRKIFRTMSLNTVDDFFRRRPWSGLTIAGMLILFSPVFGRDEASDALCLQPSSGLRN